MLRTCERGASSPLSGCISRALMGRWPAYEAALKAHGKTHEAFTYEGAKLTWERRLTFFAVLLASTTIFRRCLN